MQLRGFTLAQFESAVATVNPSYDGNLRVHQDAHQTGAHNVVGRLTVVSSSGEGARRSWSGRKCQAACWHAFRDVIRALFVLNPQGTIVTSLARYTGDNFEAVYPATGCQNIGSQFQPAYMPELCDC